MIDGSLLQIEMLGNKVFYLIYCLNLFSSRFEVFLLKEIDVTGCLGIYQVIKSKMVQELKGI